MNNIKIITDTYFNPKYGFKSAQKIYEHLKDKNITLKEVKDILKNINVKQIKQKVNNKDKLFIPIVDSETGVYQIDITFYIQYSSVNNGYKMLLTIINIASKKAYVYASHNKSASSINKLIKE